MIKVIPLINGYLFANDNDPNAVELTDQQFQEFNEGYLIWNETLTELVENTMREANVKAEVENLKRHAEDLLRLERAKLLAAFDILKTNTYWGILEVTQDEKNLINNWYEQVLDLNADAIKNPPTAIIKYIQR